MTTGAAKEDFTPTPSLDPSVTISVGEVPASAAVVGVPVGVDGEVPAEVGFDRARLVAAGFAATVGATLVLPTSGGPTKVAVGIGDAGALDATALRNAAAAFARAAASHADLAFSLSGLDSVAPEIAAQAVVEGVLLARYRYDALRTATARALRSPSSP